MSVAPKIHASHMYMQRIPMGLHTFLFLLFDHDQFWTIFNFEIMRFNRYQVMKNWEYVLSSYDDTLWELCFMLQKKQSIYLLLIEFIIALSINKL